MNSLDDPNSPVMINRRDAIKRATMLLGVAVSSSTIAGCMGGGSSETNAGDNWNPDFLNGTQGKVAKAVANIIFPTTDTPGAVDVGVPQFMDLLYGKYMDAEEKTTFTTGLGQLSKSGFQDMSETDQASAMTALAGTTDKSQKAFLQQIRGLTIVGYFKSEEVCRNVTNYDPVPGKYKACLPISETGNVIMSEIR